MCISCGREAHAKAVLSPHLHDARKTKPPMNANIDRAPNAIGSLYSLVSPFQTCSSVRDMPDSSTSCLVWPREYGGVNIVNIVSPQQAKTTPHVMRINGIGSEAEIPCISCAETNERSSWPRHTWRLQQNRKREKSCLDPKWPTVSCIWNSLKGNLTRGRALGGL